MTTLALLPDRSLHLRRVTQLILLSPRLLLRSLKPLHHNPGQKRRPELFGLFHGFRFHVLYLLARSDDAFHVANPDNSGTLPSNEDIARRCTKLVAQNRISAAATALEGHGVAHTVLGADKTALQEKFPARKADHCSLSAEVPLFPQIQHNSQLTFTSDELLYMAKRTNNYTAPGPSGMTAEALLFPLKKLEQTPVDLEFIANLKYLIEQIVRGDVHCTDYLRDATLIPLQKPDGGIRPICVGEILRRFASRLLLKKFRDQICHVLGASQACMSKGGIEQTIFHAQEFLHRYPEGILVSLDLANAFNEVSRSSIRQALCKDFQNLVPFYDAFYSQDVRLYVNKFTDSIVCGEGVCQGDAWGPAFFCLAIAPVLSATTLAHPDCLLRFYADDGTLLFRDSSTTHATLTFLADEFLSLGLNVRMEKCVAYSPSSSLTSVMFPTGLELHAVDPNNQLQLAPGHTGVKLLGSFIGSEEFIRSQLLSLANHFSTSLGRLHILKDDPQLVLLLLRYSLNTRLSHLFRTNSRNLTNLMATKVDHDVNELMSSLFGFPAHGDESDVLAWPTHFRICRLPGHRGGLGITALSSIVDSAFVGGFAAAWPALSAYASDATSLSAQLVTDVVTSLTNIWGSDFHLPEFPMPLQDLVLRIRQDSVSDLMKILSPAGLTMSISSQDFEERLNAHFNQVAETLTTVDKLQHRLSRHVSSKLYVSILRTLSSTNDVLSKYRLARFLSQASSECMMWCGAIPTSSELVIPPAAMNILLRFSVGLPLPGFSRIQHSQCSCNQSLGHEGYHLLSCYRTLAHDKAVRVIHSMCRASKLASEVEPVGILHGERRPDVLVSNLSPSGSSTILDFATVDPTRETSLMSSWCTPGAAILQREHEKFNSYQNQYNVAHYSFIPLVMELSGKMSTRLKAFIQEVAAFASRHLPTGGIGQRRFRSRFCFFWRTRINVVYLKALASSALSTQQQILDRLPSALGPISFDFTEDIF